MKRPQKIIAGILGIAILAAAGIALVNKTSKETAQVSAQNSVQESIIDQDYPFDENKYKTMDQQQMLDSLNKLSKEDLIQEANAFANAFLKDDPEALMAIAGAFLEPQNEFSLEETVKYVKDPLLNVAVKELLIELQTMRTIGSTEQNPLKDLLKDPAVDPQIKSRLVLSVKMDQTDIELLRTFVESDNLNLSVQSMKALSHIDEQAAVDLANKILSSRFSEPREKVSMALRVVGKYMRGKSSADEESKFIELCKVIIKDAQDKTLQDSAIFALSDLGSKAGLRVLLQNPSVDSGTKVRADA